MEPNAAGPTSRTRPKDRREQILRAAFKLIAASGFNAVSLGDIAAASGIQKSSVLYHFPSMNELLLAVLGMREVQDLDFYLDLPPATDPASARRLFTRMFARNLEREEFVRLYTILSAEALAADHPAHDYFAARARMARNEVARLLAWNANPRIAAAELLAFWDGLELVRRDDPSVDVRAVWESFCERFFQ